MSKLAKILLLWASCLCGSAGVAQEVFEFAGYTFDQRNTPDRGALLGNGVNLGGAQFSAGVPTTTTGIILGFPQSSAGYNGALALGALTGFGTTSRAVNLPNGNSGVTIRHGIEVWWSGSRGLPNLNGDDIVIFEAASSISSVEGVMIRARQARTSLSEPERWTPWSYNPPDAFAVTMGVEGAFANAFDLSDLGVAAGERIDRIQMANLLQADRIAGPGILIGGTLVGSGRVVFDGSSVVLPDAGAFDPDNLFDSSTLDPDPLYAAVLHNIVALPPLFTLVNRQVDGVALDVESAPGVWRIESADALAADAWKLMERFTVITAGTAHFLDTGQNGRPSPLAVPMRFYRVRSD